MTLEVLAIVPARAGSKGLPGKNLLAVAGRTLVARAVDAARGAAAVTRVVGSTDDPAIARALLDAGAEVPALRPAALSGDDVPDAPVFLHVLDLLAADGYGPDIVVNVRPTAPLRTSADIDAAIDVLRSTPAARSVKTVSPASEHPYKMWTLSPDERLLHPLLPEWFERFERNPDVPRQALPTVYRSSGAVDAVWASAIKETAMFHPGPVAAYVIDAARDIDIDTSTDLERAEALLADAR